MTIKTNGKVMLQVSLENSKIYEINKPSLGGLGLSGVQNRNEVCDPSNIPELPNLDNRGSAMSNERFIKFIPTEEAMWLLKYKGHAFRLLAIIAECARRYEGGPDGLHIGEAFIGGHENYGMSEQNYRTAKDILIARQHIKIVETNRTRKKSTNGVTTVGTKVKLLSTTIWDINLEVDNDRPNDWLTTDQRLTNDKLRKIRIKESKEEEYIVPNGTLAPTPSSHRKKIARPTDSISYSFESGSFEGISEKDIADWKEAYPKADIRKELAAQVQWLKSNPSKSKKKNWRKFITNWLAKADEKAVNRSAYSSNSFSSIQSCKDKILEKFIHGNVYNGAECWINEDGIAFQRGNNHRSVRFSERGFQDQFKNLLLHFGIADV